MNNTDKVVPLPGQPQPKADETKVAEAKRPRLPRHHVELEKRLRERMQAKFEMEFDVVWDQFETTLYDLSLFRWWHIPGCCNRIKRYPKALKEDAVHLEFATEEIALVNDLLDQMCRAETMSSRDLFSFSACKRRFMMPLSDSIPMFLEASLSDIPNLRDDCLQDLTAFIDRTIAAFAKGQKVKWPNASIEDPLHRGQIGKLELDGSLFEIPIYFRNKEFMNKFAQRLEGMFIGHLSNWKNIYSLKGSDADLWKPTKEVHRDKMFLKRCHVFVSAMAIYEELLNLVTPVDHHALGKAESRESASKLVAFLKQGGIDLEAGPDAVLGRSTSFWSAQVGADSFIRPRSYSSTVSERTDSDASFVSLWLVHMGYCAHRILKGMQPLAVTMIKRELVYIRSIIEFKALFNQKVFILLATLAIALFSALADVLVERWDL